MISNKYISQGHGFNKFDLEKPVATGWQLVGNRNRLQPVVQLQKTDQDRWQPVHVGCSPVFLVLPF